MATTAAFRNSAEDQALAAGQTVGVISEPWSQLVTAPDFERDPPGLAVRALMWDSGFQGSGLRVGDRIVAVAGDPVVPPTTPEEAERTISRMIGGLSEASVWADAGRHDGDPLALTVRRKKLPRGWEEIEIVGAIRSERGWRDKDDRPILGPLGPIGLANDGFAGSWGGWWDQSSAQWQRALVRYLQGSSLSAADVDQEASQARVDFLAAHYPGPFTSAVQAGWAAIMAILDRGAETLPPGFLDYRRAEEEDVQQVREQAQAAWAAFQSGLAATTIPTFPAVHPTQGDLASVVGKHVVLPVLHNQDWISEAGHTWFVAGGAGDGWYFVDAESEPSQAMLLAARRYTRLVAPNLGASYEMVVRILKDPGLLVIDERGYFGLNAEVAGAFVGEAMFVDVTQRDGDLAPFAGEEAFAQPAEALPPDDASPAEVMTAVVGAIKEGDLARWRSLFADWYVDRLEDGRPVVYPHTVKVEDNRFETARQLILGKVVEVRPVWTDDPVVITDGSAFEHAPVIEEAEVEMEHVCEVDGVYKICNGVTVQRRWKLQRVDGGPWRITTVNAL